MNHRISKLSPKNQGVPSCVRTIIAPCIGIFAGIGCCGCTGLLFGIMLLVFWLEPDTSKEDMDNMFVNVSGMLLSVPPAHRRSVR